MTTCLERLQRWLREEHIPYSLQHHRQALTLAELALEAGEKAVHVAKVVVADVDGQLVMLVVPAPAQVDLRRVARLLKAHAARPARSDELASRCPDCEPEAIPPFGSLYEMTTYFDESLAQSSRLVFRAGTARDTLKVATDDYRRAAVPVSGPIVRQQPEPLAAA
jgi:Ala-tRNA(Pro) deacylase